MQVQGICPLATLPWPPYPLPAFTVRPLRHPHPDPRFQDRSPQACRAGPRHAGQALQATPCMSHDLQVTPCKPASASRAPRPHHAVHHDQGQIDLRSAAPGPRSPCRSPRPTPQAPAPISPGPPQRPPSASHDQLGRQDQAHQARNRAPQLKTRAPEPAKEPRFEPGGRPSDGESPFLHDFTVEQPVHQVHTDMTSSTTSPGTTALDIEPKPTRPPCSSKPARACAPPAAMAIEAPGSAERGQEGLLESRAGLEMGAGEGGKPPPGTGRACFDLAGPAVAVEQGLEPSREPATTLDSSTATAAGKGAAVTSSTTSENTATAAGKGAAVTSSTTSENTATAAGKGAAVTSSTTSENTSRPRARAKPPPRPPASPPGRTGEGGARARAGGADSEPARAPARQTEIH